MGLTAAGRVVVRFRVISSSQESVDTETNRPDDVFKVFAINFPARPRSAPARPELKDRRTVYLATPVVTDFEKFRKQASVERMVVPSPIPPEWNL